MRARIRRWFAEATDQAIIRVVATTVGLLAYIVWGAFFLLPPRHRNIGGLQGKLRDRVFLAPSGRVIAGRRFPPI